MPLCRERYWRNSATGRPAVDGKIYDILRRRGAGARVAARAAQQVRDYSPPSQSADGNPRLPRPRGDPSPTSGRRPAPALPNRLTRGKNSAAAARPSAISCTADRAGRWQPRRRCPKISAWRRDRPASTSRARPRGRHINHGCHGGTLPSAWQYLDNTGIVDNACMPYGWKRHRRHVQSGPLPCLAGNGLDQQVQKV